MYEDKINFPEELVDVIESSSRRPYLGWKVIGFGLLFIFLILYTITGDIVFFTLTDWNMFTKIIASVFFTALFCGGLGLTGKSLQNKYYEFKKYNKVGYYLISWLDKNQVLQGKVVSFYNLYEEIYELLKTDTGVFKFSEGAWKYCFVQHLGNSREGTIYRNSGSQLRAGDYKKVFFQRFKVNNSLIKRNVYWVSIAYKKDNALSNIYVHNILYTTYHLPEFGVFSPFSILTKLADLLKEKDETIDTLKNLLLSTTDQLRNQTNVGKNDAVAVIKNHLIDQHCRIFNHPVFGEEYAITVFTEAGEPYEIIHMYFMDLASARAQARYLAQTKMSAETQVVKYVIESHLGEAIEEKTYRLPKKRLTA